MAWSQAVIREIVGIAKRHSIDPAALLAVADVESAGRPIEWDGITPRFLFERHKFYEALRRYAPGLLGKAIEEGLARPDWNRRQQYFDMSGTQANWARKKATLDRARSISRDAADYACSWGLGQVMGYHFAAQGFPSPSAFVTAMQVGGIPAQVQAFVKEILNDHLQGHLNDHAWAAFARGYNGAGYAQNQYDTKMANAHARWDRYLQANPVEPIEEQPQPETPMQAVPQTDDPASMGPAGKSIGFLGSISAMGLAALGWVQDHPYIIAISVSIVVVLLSAYIAHRRRLKREKSK